MGKRQYDGKPVLVMNQVKKTKVCRDADESMTPAKESASREKEKRQTQDSSPKQIQNQLTDKGRPKRKTMKASYSNWRADLEQLDEGDYRRLVVLQLAGKKCFSSE